MNRPAAIGVKILAIAATFAIVVPLVEYVDTEHPIHNPPYLVLLATKILVRGGFFVLLITLIVLFGQIVRLLLPGFPEGCATIAELSLFTDTSITRDGGENGWTLDEVNAEVRSVFATVARMPEDSLSMQRTLNE